MTVITQDMSLGNSLLMNSNSTNDLLQGVGGRKCVLSASSSVVNPVVKAPASNFWDFTKSALIENLIIDGKNYPSVTGILLQNVVKCQVRNVTIRNCDVGIHVRCFNGRWSECNSLKHIRMENVKKGIVFTTTGKDPNNPNGYPGDSAAFTLIDDVDIGLANYSDAVGIQIGGIQITNDPETNDAFTGSFMENGNTVTYNTIIKPYSSRIFAIVRLGSNGGTGLKIINGELKHAQAHLTVTGPSNGVGVDIQNHPVTNLKQDKVIWYNQFSEFNSSDTVTKKGFMLVTSGIDVSNRIKPSGILTDIETKTL